MPDGFNPQQVLENGKAPGLNIADLHTMGITGKGITVAIIDQPLNTEHIEIRDNIIHYESAGYPEHKEAQFHGTAVSSLLAGKTCGVARHRCAQPQCGLAMEAWTHGSALLSGTS